MSDMYGVITFFSSSHAVHAEQVLKKAGYGVEMIPGPKEISPNCGVALRGDYGQMNEMLAMLESNGVLYEAGHQYIFRKEKSLLDKLLGR